MEPLTSPAKAKAEFDMARGGVRIIVSPEPGVLLLWEPATYKREDPQTAAMTEPHEAWLPLREDVARAVYEALAEYYGHDVVNARQLRRDYEAERKRVDKLIDATINTRTAP